ncbi:hypothetical protein NL676_034385 [Syzygium grande]|nr:hypothetical protein NL676_034385 [Syzygium grande]
MGISIIRIDKNQEKAMKQMHLHETVSFLSAFAQPAGGRRVYGTVRSNIYRQSVSARADTGSHRSESEESMQCSAWLAPFITRTARDFFSSCPHCTGPPCEGDETEIGFIEQERAPRADDSVLGLIFADGIGAIGFAGTSSDAARPAAPPQIVRWIPGVPRPFSLSPHGDRTGDRDPALRRSRGKGSSSLSD